MSVCIQLTYVQLENRLRLLFACEGGKEIGQGSIRFRFSLWNSSSGTAKLKMAS